MTRNFHWEQCKLEDGCKVWEYTMKPLSVLTPILTVGIPEMTFSFSNLPEGCTKFTEDYYTHSYYLLQQNDYRLKSAQKKMDGAESQKILNMEIPVVFCQGIRRQC